MVAPGPADLAAYGSATLFLAFAVQRFAALRGHRGNRGDRVSLYAGGFALCMAGGLVALAPSTLAAVSIGSNRELTLLFGDLLKTGAVGLLALIALLLQGPRDDPAAARARLRRWLVALLVVPLALVLLYRSAHITDRGQEFMVHGWRRWPLAGYDLLFGGYGAACLVVLGSVLARQTRLATGNLLRTGLRLMTLAAGVGVLWCAWTLDDVRDVLLHAQQKGGEDTVSNLVGVVCAGLTVSGATATVWGGTRWGARITAPVRWWRARRSYAVLGPLWEALHRAMPEIALGEGGEGRRLALRDAEFALYRRVIEIRDGQLALRPYVGEQVAVWVAEEQRAGGLRGPDGAVDGAAVEAATLAAALEAARAGQRCRDATVTGVPQPVPGPGTVDAEAQWLIRVAAAFDGCAAVAAVRRRAVEALAALEGSGAGAGG
ncbi:MAB_1171c family putative transporter [Kitasatospora sp. GAS1066B]|uniref:MAB_1171c family putative transporter n=1 Tax=Kitasatospora sp. GAS1066B TaxID=3156271 RepID=UPI0035170261